MPHVALVPPYPMDAVSLHASGAAGQHLQHTLLRAAFGSAGRGGATPKRGRYSLGTLVAMRPHCVCICSCFCPDKMKVVVYLKPICFHIIWCLHCLQALMSLLSHIIRQQETHQNALDNTKLINFFFSSRRMFSIAMSVGVEASG